MLYKKQGLPEEDELVLCTITNIHFHSVFAKLDEYDKSGMIHISEISPGRIRNIADFVQEGKKVVCKVLKVDPVKGHIDLSLRRVNEKQKKKKIEQIKQEQKAEKILEIIATKHKLDTKKLYDEIISKSFKKYETLHDLFLYVVKGEEKLEDYVQKKLVPELLELISMRIKLPEVRIKSEFFLQSFEPDGIEAVKTVLEKVYSIGKGTATIKYKGGGKYNVEIITPDYKTGEELLENMTKKAEELMKGKGNFSFERKDKAK